MQAGIPLTLHEALAILVAAHVRQTGASRSVNLKPSPTDRAAYAAAWRTVCDELAAMEQARGLRFVIDVRGRDGYQIEEVLALVGHSTVARAAYEAATLARPQRCVVLRAGIHWIAQSR